VQQCHALARMPPHAHVHRRRGARCGQGAGHVCARASQVLQALLTQGSGKSAAADGMEQSPAELAQALPDRAAVLDSPTFQKAELSEQEVELITDVVSQVLARTGVSAHMDSSEQVCCSAAGHMAACMLGRAAELMRT